jgi:hypothetical protein
MRAFIAQTPLLKKGRQLSTGFWGGSVSHESDQQQGLPGKFPNVVRMCLLSWRQINGALPSIG